MPSHVIRFGEAEQKQADALFHSIRGETYSVLTMQSIYVISDRMLDAVEKAGIPFVSVTWEEVRKIQKEEAKISPEQREAMFYKTLERMKERMNGRRSQV